MRVLAVGAHPDDVELGCGGTLLRHLARGDEITISVMTGGERGVYDARSRQQRTAVRGRPRRRHAHLGWLRRRRRATGAGRDLGRRPRRRPLRRRDPLHPCARRQPSGSHRHVVGLPRRGTAGAHRPVLRDAVDARVHADRVHRPRRRDGTEDQPRAARTCRRCCATARSTSTRSSPRRGSGVRRAGPSTPRRSGPRGSSGTCSSAPEHAPAHASEPEPARIDRATELRAISEVAGSLSR